MALWVLGPRLPIAAAACSAGKSEGVPGLEANARRLFTKTNGCEPSRAPLAKQESPPDLACRSNQGQRLAWASLEGKDEQDPYLYEPNGVPGCPRSGPVNIKGQGTLWWQGGSVCNCEFACPYEHLRALLSSLGRCKL